MLNLTRYRVDIGDIAGTPVASFSKDINGEFVKFDDIKEFLKPAHNIKRKPSLCFTCKKSLFCNPHNNYGVRALKCLKYVKRSGIASVS